LREPHLDSLRARDDERASAARELGIKQEERQTGKVIAMKMGDEDQLDVIADDFVVLQRRQRRGTAIDQEVDRVSRDMKTGVGPAARAEGVATADKSQLHRLFSVRAVRRTGATGARSESRSRRQAGSSARAS